MVQMQSSKQKTQFFAALMQKQQQAQNNNKKLLQLFNQQLHQHQTKIELVQQSPQDYYQTLINSTQQMGCNQYTKDNFKEMLTNTNLSYVLTQSSYIYKLRSKIQNKVFNFISGHQQQYLSQFKHFYTKQALQTAFLCIQKVNQCVTNDITNRKYSLKRKKTNINTIKKEIDQSFLELNKKKEHIKMSYPQIDVYVKDQEKKKVKKQTYQKLKKLRQKELWYDQQKSKSVSLLLQKVSFDKKKHEQRYKQSLQKSISQIQQSLDKEKIQKVQRVKHRVKMNIEKYKIYKQKQSKYKQEKIQKQKQVLQLLNSFKGKKSIHQKLQQDYQQNIARVLQQQYKKRLTQIHEQRKIIPLKQFIDHKYQFQQIIKTKSSQNQQKLKKYKLYTKKQQHRLRKLFHSQHHKYILQEGKQPIFDEKQFKRQMKIKMLSYSEEISKKHKPRIDQSKRLQIQEILLKSSKSKNKKKLQKLLRFSNQFINQGEKQQMLAETQISPKEQGLQYLKFIRGQNKDKPRKKQAKPNPQTEGKKIYDRSLQIKDHYKIRMTLSEWKKILQKEGISKKQKKELLQNYSIKLNLQKIKLQEQHRNKGKDISKQIKINQQLQKCYIQQAKSKLTLLKL